MIAKQYQKILETELNQATYLLLVLVVGSLQLVKQVKLERFAQSRVWEVHGQRMLDRTFQPGFKLNLHRKDMNIVLQTGKELNLPLLGAAQVTELMNAMIAQGKGELDNSALITLYELLSPSTPLEDE